MEQKRQLYPIGIQTFSKIREGNYMYIDKTGYVYKMTHSEATSIFLSRPRRFGKSLLASTLHSYFEGRKELFKGLTIERLEKDWIEYPVLHFDMSLGKHLSKKELIEYLSSQLEPYEELYGIVPEVQAVNIRLTNLIRKACQQTGRKVAVLADEYDAPLLDVIHEESNLPELRNIMRNFYSPLKACDPYLRFVFLTGITKFSQLSIFSELNNIMNISMDEEYAAVCGVTQDELESRLQEGIHELAERQGMTVNQALDKLKDNYDGYHFTVPSPDIYNPFSLLTALSKRKMDSYWFGSGTPTYLVEMLRKFHVIPQEIGDRQCLPEDFDAPTERMSDITPLLYQSGYITIKAHDSLTDIYTLGIPNKEVKIGLMRSLLGNYIQLPRIANTTVALMAGQILHENIDGALKLLQEFLGTVPYCDNIKSEGHYQQLLYVIFSLLGYRVDIEVRTPQGRVDIVMRTASHLYIIELKLNKDASTAMRQIDLKNYPERFALSGLPIVKVGINFDSETRTITDWEIQ